MKKDNFKNKLDENAKRGKKNFDCILHRKENGDFFKSEEDSDKSPD